MANSDKNTTFATTKVGKAAKIPLKQVGKTAETPLIWVGKAAEITKDSKQLRHKYMINRKIYNRINHLPIYMLMFIRPMESSDTIIRFAPI